MEVTLLVVTWVITLLCGTAGLIAVSLKLNDMRSKLADIERAWQLEAEVKRTAALELAQLPPVPERNETAFDLGGKQVFRLSREHQGRAQ